MASAESGFLMTFSRILESAIILVGPQWSSKLLSTVVGVLGPREYARGRSGDDREEDGRDEGITSGVGVSVGR